MKKVLSLVLVIAMVLSSVSFVFAYDDVDADNTALASAVEALNSLKIIQGYEDGTFRPEKVVTRAEMAKMLIVARGLELLATETPAFTDCQKHWAAGYIALASDLGIINGRGNGIFDPDATVTYQEAAVMMLRALGYTNETINGGKSDAYNAANYKTKALNLGLFSQLDGFKVGDGANRGDIALMLNVNLLNKMVFTNETGRAEEDGTLLIDNIASIDNNFNVTVAQLSKGHSVDLTNYLYQNLTVYKNEDGKVVYVVKSNVKTYTGSLTEDVNTTDSVVRVTLADDTVKNLTLAAATTPVFYNGAETTNTEATLESYDLAKLVLDVNGQVVGAIVEEYDAPLQVLATYITGKTQFAGYALPTDEDGAVDFDCITVDGDATSLSDIMVGDIIEVAQAADESVIKFTVTRDTVEGKVNKIDKTTGKYYIDDVAYYLNGIELELKDEGTFYLDRNGYIAAFEPTTVAVTYNYAIVLGTASGSVGADVFTGAQSITQYPRIKMVDMDGKASIYEVAVVLNSDGTIKSNATGFDMGVTAGELTVAANIASGATYSGDMLVQYAVDSNGRISAIKAVALNNGTMKTSNINFLAGENTVIIDDSDDGYTLTTVDELISDSAITFKYVGTAAGWDLVITNDAIPAEATSQVYGIVTNVANALNADGDAVQEITAIVDGKVVTLLTDSATTVVTPADIKGKVVGFVQDADDQVTAVEEAVALASDIPSVVTGTYLILDTDDTTRYTYDSNLVVYKQAANESVSVGDIYDVQFIKGEKEVQLFDADGDGLVDIIFIPYNN